MPGRTGSTVVLFWVALVCFAAGGCGSGDEDMMGPCPDCANQTVTMANQAMESALFDELNTTPERPSDVDFTAAFGLYEQAVSEDPGNRTARFGAAVTGLLVLTTDAEVNAAFDEWDAYTETPFDQNPIPKPGLLGIPVGLATGADGLRLPFGVVATSVLAYLRLPLIAQDPQIGRIQAIFRERVIPRLVQSVDHLGHVISDPDYVFTVTARMQGDLEADPAEIDHTDILLLRAAASLLTAATRIAVAYDLNLAEYDVSVLRAAMQPGSGWLALTTDGTTHMQTARLDFLRAVGDVDAGLASLLAETDLQDDDVIKIGPDGVSRTEIDDIRAEIPNVRALLENGYTRIDDWDGSAATPDQALAINVGNLLRDPIADWKALLPDYNVSFEGRYHEGDCVWVPVIEWQAATFEEWLLPDPTFHGLLPGIGSTNELWNLFGVTAADYEPRVVLDWTDPREVFNCEGTLP